jgi:hypothetical protein
MATDILPSNSVISGAHDLPNISFPKPVESSHLPGNPSEIVSEWTSSFNDILKDGKTDVAEVFLKESYWRDLLCLTWNFHTIAGSEQISSFISGLPKKWRLKSINADTSSDFRKPKIAALDYPGSHKCIQSFLTLETDVGNGSGLVRLLPDENGKWKCYTLFTVLEELKGYEENIYTRRPKGVDYKSRSDRSNWKDDRIREENLETGDEPVVLIIGMFPLAWIIN